MGDRGTVEIKDQGKSVYLYTHWTGSNLKETVTRAIKSHNGQRRLNDAAYLARIIFDHMTEGDRDAETGFGISAHPCDGKEHIVDIDKRTLDGIKFADL